MNLTRAWTLAGRAGGIRGVLSVGRVQSPTLQLVVQRDLDIENFVPVDHYVVEADCTSVLDDGVLQFSAVWSPDDEQREQACDSEGRCTDRDFAVRVATDLTGAEGRVVSSKTEPGREPPPLPFSLSRLQQLASRRWGYAAKQTLEIAQSLYEQHKAITYPRTDTGYLPEDQHAEAGSVLGALRESLGSSGAVGGRIAKTMQGADPALKSPAWNDRKITAHHGMVPTAQPVSLDALSEEERNIFLEIAQRYALQFWPDHEFIRTSLVIEAAGHTLKASGRQTVVPGWKEILVPDSGDDDAGDGAPEDHGPVPFIPEGHAVQVAQVEVLERKTKPPKPYTEGTLIRAMTNIGREVRDPEIRKLLREHDGIGTEATRAEIITTLKKREFIETVKRKLRSTDRGRQLIAALPDSLTDPGTTALMEQRLAAVESGEISLSAYIGGQALFVTRMVEFARQSAMGAGRRRPDSSGGTGPGNPPSAEDLGDCPECGKALLRRKGKYGFFVGCSGYPECRYIMRSGKDDGGAGSARPGPVVRDDFECPKCGKPMVERKGKKGPFFGCTRFPECRGTRKVEGGRARVPQGQGRR